MPPASSSRADLREHISELDGVRAIAVWLVLLGHALDGWRVSAAAVEPIPLPIRLIARYGWLGVDLFFVLSGFLITGILLRTRAHPNYYRNFYARRILRIVPVYFVVIGVCWFLYGGEYNSYFLLSLLFMANFYYPLGIAIPHGPGVFWSLAIEEHFYLVWPFVVRLLKTRGLLMVALAICVLSPVVRVIAKSRGFDLINEIYCITWFRLDGLAFGALLALWWQSPYAEKTQSSLKFAALIFAMFILETVALVPAGILESGSPLRYNQAHLLFGAFLMAVLGLRGTVWTMPLRWRFARWSGDLSYCIYLIHLSVGDGYEALVRWAGWNPIASIGDFGALALRSTFMICVSFALAAASRRLIELPALRLKRYFT